MGIVTNKIPISLYLHLPWCVNKCPYCDFNSHRAPTKLPERAYVDALLTDLDTDRDALQERRLHSLFIGGGTPSLFSPQSIDRLLQGVRARLTLTPDCEISLEANPGTIDDTRFGEFCAAGINRLSIGIQSLDDDCLRRLGRIHDARAARQAVDKARQAGFDNLNLDLMYGLPGQDTKGALADLSQACDLGPEHLSWYQLTIEPNTRFAVDPPALPDEEESWQMQVRGHSLLHEQGYAQYEISAFARDGARCRHNLNYWRFGDYLGIGAGAHGKLSDAGSGQVRRTVRYRQPAGYLHRAARGEAVITDRVLSQADLVLEFAMNGFRLTEGVSEETFARHTGLDPALLGPGMRRGGALGLVTRAQGLLQPTARGQRFLNELLQGFMPR